MSLSLGASAFLAVKWGQLCPSWKHYGAFCTSDPLQCPQIPCKRYIYICFSTQLLYSSHTLSLHRGLGGEGKQLCLGTLGKIKQKCKSCIVPKVRSCLNTAKYYQTIAQIPIFPHVQRIKMNGEQYPPAHKKQAPGQLPIPAAEGLPPGTQALPTAISMLLTAGPLKTGAA